MRPFVAWAYTSQFKISIATYIFAIGIVGLVNLSFAKPFFYKFWVHSAILISVLAASFLSRLVRSRLRHKPGKPVA